jgi:CubicO group peptidase (beta-lactamase class C family)
MSSIPALPNVARSYSNLLFPEESAEVVNCNTVFGDGSVFSTAHDMALWNRYLENHTVVGTKASMDEAYQPARVGGGTVPYGFGWSLRDRAGAKQYSHAGSWAGYHTLNVRLPEKHFSVVVLTNGPRADLEAIISKAIETYGR